MPQLVQTVLGAVDPQSLGRIMHHEHLVSLVPGPWLSGGRATSTPADTARAGYEGDDDHVIRAVGALSGLKALGIDTVVDLSPYDVVGRSDHGDNVALLQTISEHAGIHIVAGSSIYLEPYSPHWSREMTLDELTDRFTRDVTTGIGTTSIRAGILGEQATGLDEVTAHEEKCLRASARAQAGTGVALVTHTTHGTMALEQVEILRQESADLTRVVIGHMDIQPDLDYVLRVLDTGTNIAFDTIGKQFWDFVLEPGASNPPDGEFTKRAYFRSDVRRAERLVELVERGYVEQLFVSLDLTGAEVYLNPTTHGQWGYAYLAGDFLPTAASIGLRDKDRVTLLRRNPLRLLTQDSS